MAGLSMAGRARVLVVDDDEEMRALLEEALSEEGYAVGGAPDALAAMIHIFSRPTDVLVVVWKMPDVDGLDLLDTIKRCFPEMPVIFVTAFAQPGLCDKAIQKGAFGFLAKPFSLGELLYAVDQAAEEVFYQSVSRQLREQGGPAEETGGHRAGEKEP